MASSTLPAEEDAAPRDARKAPREAVLETVAAQALAIDELIELAEHRIQVFDIDFSQGGWATATRAETLTRFFRRAPNPRLEVIVHDTRWIETSAARLVALLRQFSHAITLYRTGAEAQSVMDPLMIVDDVHLLHRFHISQPRASLSINNAQVAKPFIARFGEIWATGEPGLTGTVLGL
jgi:hypothetical protein